MPTTPPAPASPAPTRAPEPGPAAVRLLLTWLVVLGVVLGWGWLLVHPLAGSVGQADNDLSRLDRRAPHERVGNTVADVGTFLGDTIFGAALLTVLGVGFSWWQRSWRPFVFVLVGYLGLFVIYLVTTAVDTRDRPPVKILDPGLVPDHSYPSGHVMTAMTLLGVSYLLTRAYAWPHHRWTLVLVVLPVLTLLARLYQGAHHLTDTLTSVVVALVWLGAVSAAVLGRPRRSGALSGG